MSEIISVIDEIAFQTNLLALNAAVEAARAGEHGRGFAVVASEVRSLASRSATAAKQIEGLIKDSVAKASSGKKLVDESGHVFEEIVDSVQETENLVRSIANSSSEQEKSVTAIDQAVQNMDQLSQQNIVQTETTKSLNEKLQEQAQQLEELVKFFKVSANEHDSFENQHLRAV